MASNIRKIMSKIYEFVMVLTSKSKKNKNRAITEKGNLFRGFESVRNTIAKAYPKVSETPDM